MSDRQQHTRIKTAVIKNGPATTNLSANIDTATEKATTAVLLDDPCWGDPDHCSLEYLLTRITRQDTVLYESPNYILLNKPADLRMDGPYPATIHKLMTYWYPPPSLQGLPDQDLLEKLKSLHNHSEVRDNTWRPCHQLDYATSGVLLMAFSPEAANHACTCFEKRLVRKTYLAVLHGHVQVTTSPGSDGKKREKNIQTTTTEVDTPNGISSSSLLLKKVPTMSSRQLQEFLETQQERQRLLAARPRRDTFQGYQPPNAFLQILAGRHARKQGTAIRKRKRNEKLSDEQWEEVDTVMNLNEDEHAFLAKTSWKVLRKIAEHAKLKVAVEKATEHYNNILKDILTDEQKDKHIDAPVADIKELPTVFCVTEDNTEKIKNETKDNQQSFYISLSVAQVADDFAMRIPSQFHKDHPATWLNPGDESKLLFKTGLTKCTILQHTTLNGQPITKVLLEPRTGRRHQLRVHTAIIGHPIVGDHTYECRYSNGDRNEANPPELSPRMCLHAYMLDFPLPPPEGLTTGDINGKKKTSTKPIAEDNRLLTTSSDPFQVNPEGLIEISNT